MCVCMYELSPLLCCSYRGQLESMLNFAYAIADSPSERERKLCLRDTYLAQILRQSVERGVCRCSWHICVCVCMCIDAELSMRE